MIARVHPLSGELIQPKSSTATDPRREIADFYRTLERRAAMSYDAARSGTDLDSHWAFSDSNDADSANNPQVRHTLMKRGRYEVGSNAYFAGIIATHCNMLVGVGPTLRMLSGDRNFNQLVEREWYAWTQMIQLRRKLWAMAHARTADGEVFGIMQTNPGFEKRVQLDLVLLEGEQCQTPFLPYDLKGNGYIDGIKFDEFNNVLWYDILPNHPGSAFATFDNPIQVAAREVLHWFKLKRPGGHRGVSDLTPGLNTGAYGRRFREATVAAAESAASIAAMLKTNLNAAGDTEPDPVAPFTSVEFAKRMLMIAPMGWDVTQMKSEHPNAEYCDFNRTLISELSRGISMPYNAAACDSSTYSFASGKLDTLCYRAALDVERQDCNDLVLNPLFATWFREWTIFADRRDMPPSHQWDWPMHPVIDAVAEESAKKIKLETGTLALRKAFADQGEDYEDNLTVMAEDWFGEANEATVAKARTINLLRTIPQAAMPYVAGLLGITASPISPAQPAGASV